jgi:hypothetical protein
MVNLINLGSGLGRYGCATFNNFLRVDSWLGVVADLGCVSAGKRYGANRGGMGISFNRRLVDGGGSGERREPKGGVNISLNEGLQSIINSCPAI